MHHLGLIVGKILDGKGYRSLYPIEVIVDTKSLQNKERCRNPT